MTAGPGPARNRDCSTAKDGSVTESKKKNRHILHVELTPRMRAKLDGIVAELKDDPRLEGVDVTRQTALRHAVICYPGKELAG